MTDTAMTNTAAAPASAPTETKHKLNVAMRYLGSNATGGLAVFVALGTLTPDQQVAILKSANQMYEATYSFVGAAANIWYIVFPIVGVWLAKLGWNASGVGTMMDNIFAMAKAGNVQAKVAIVNAAASPAIGSQGVVNPELAANPATAGNVVSSPAAVPVALPENPARPS
jgi:hypothetical protein